MYGVQGRLGIRVPVPVLITVQILRVITQVRAQIQHVGIYPSIVDVHWAWVQLSFIRSTLYMSATPSIRTVDMISNELMFFPLILTETITTRHPYIKMASRHNEDDTHISPLSTDSFMKSSV
jgi:hypothetical protein